MSRIFKPLSKQRANSQFHYHGNIRVDSEEVFLRFSLISHLPPLPLPRVDSKAHKLQSERAKVKVFLSTRRTLYSCSYFHLGCFSYNLKLRLMLKAKVLVCHKAEFCGVKLSGKRLREYQGGFSYTFSFDFHSHSCLVSTAHFKSIALSLRSNPRNIFRIWFWLSNSSERAGCFHIDVINLRDIMSNSIFYASITHYAAS